MEIRANAKLNLTLDVLGKRPDGYHALRMIMQSVDLWDDLTLSRKEEPGVTIQTNRSYLPGDRRNLAVSAAVQLLAYLGREEEGIDIRLEKRIPVCAGLGGGSSDAAAVLCGLNQLLGAGLEEVELASLGANVGSDVPYCVIGGTVLAEGRGEILTPLRPLPRCYFVLCKPDFLVPTPELFGRIDNVAIKGRPDTAGALAALEQGDLEGVARRMYNVFEDVLPERRKQEVMAIKGILIEKGALGACMSGTGPTVFGLFREEKDASAAFRRLKEEYREVFLARGV